MTQVPAPPSLPKSRARKGELFFGPAAIPMFFPRTDPPSAALLRHHHAPRPRGSGLRKQPGAVDRGGADDIQPLPPLQLPTGPPAAAGNPEQAGAQALAPAGRPVPSVGTCSPGRGTPSTPRPRQALPSRLEAARVLWARLVHRRPRQVPPRSRSPSLGAQGLEWKWPSVRSPSPAPGILSPGPGRGGHDREGHCGPDPQTLCEPLRPRPAPHRNHSPGASEVSFIRRGSRTKAAPSKITSTTSSKNSHGRTEAPRTLPAASSWPSTWRKGSAPGEGAGPTRGALTG